MSHLTRALVLGAQANKHQICTTITQQYRSKLRRDLRSRKGLKHVLHYEHVRPVQQGAK